MSPASAGASGLRSLPPGSLCSLSELPSVGVHHYVQMSELHFQGKRMSLAPLTSSRAVLTGVSVVCLSGCLLQHCSDRAPCTRPWQALRSPAGRPPGLLGHPTAAAHAVLPASHSRSSCLPLCTQNPGGLFPPLTEAQRGGVAGPVSTQQGSSVTPGRSQTPKPTVFSPHCTAFFNAFLKFFSYF